jgi:hypothetical protein
MAKKGLKKIAKRPENAYAPDLRRMKELPEDMAQCRMSFCAK